MIVREEHATRSIYDLFDQESPIATEMRRLYSNTGCATSPRSWARPGTQRNRIGGGEIRIAVNQLPVAEAVHQVDAVTCIQRPI